MKEVLFEIGKVLFKAELSKIRSNDRISVRNCTDEKIITQKIGKFWNQDNIFDRPDGLVVITNKRFVFLANETTLKINLTTETEFMSIPYNLIRNIKSKKVWLFVPAIEFEVNNNVYTFTFLSGNIDDIVRIMEDNKY